MQPYWLRRPVPATDAATRAEFDTLLAAALAYYYFAVDNEVIEQHQFSPGTVYLLPAGGFEREAAYVEDGRRVLTAQAASLDPVEPLAKLPVEPADFPMRIRGYDLATQLRRIEADPGGFPWLAADEV